MARSWTSQPAGRPAVRLNVTPETRLRLNGLAGSAGVPMARFAREVVEAVCRGETVNAEALVARLRQEKLEQFSGQPPRPRGRARRNR